MRSNPMVSLLVDNRRNEVADFGDAVAATAHGRARELTGDEAAVGMQRYLERHEYLADFVRSPSCAMIAVDVERYDLVSSFQNVLEIRIDGA